MRNRTISIPPISHFETANIGGIDMHKVHDNYEQLVKK
jgi:hypothetical protein